MHPLYVNTEPTSKPLQNDNLKNELVYILDVVQGYIIYSMFSYKMIEVRVLKPPCWPNMWPFFSEHTFRTQIRVELSPPKNMAPPLASCWILHWAGGSAYTGCFINNPRMGVSKKRGTPKWMVKIMENPIEMNVLGGATIFGNIHITEYIVLHEFHPQQIP